MRKTLLALTAADWLKKGTQPLPGDINLDGIVNGQDLALLASQYGKTAGTMAVGNLTPPVAVDGAAFTDFTVSHFTDANPSAKASDYSALDRAG